MSDAAFSYSLDGPVTTVVADVWQCCSFPEYGTWRTIDGGLSGYFYRDHYDGEPLNRLFRGTRYWKRRFDAFRGRRFRKAVRLGIIKVLRV